MAKADTRTFKMHPALLTGVIQRQAGSLVGAVLEGVTNSIDVGCTECRITADAGAFRTRGRSACIWSGWRRSRSRPSLLPRRRTGGTSGP